jgi:tripartite-type tricarboxylate transporter receptor subunit TctC
MTHRTPAHPSPALSRRAALAGLGALLAAGRAQAQDAWPSRPVRLVTLAAPGQSTDAVARSLAEALARRWGQPVVVDNRPGGEGIISIEAFLAARDGHTLLFNPTGTWTGIHLLHERLSFEPERDMIPVSFVGQDFLALAAAPQLGVTSLAELVQAARARPGAITYASAPSIPALAMVAFQREAGIELTHVPYRNPFAALPDIAQGRVNLALLPLAPMLGPASGGQLRLLAVSSPDRAPAAPELPTAAEAGFPVLGFPGGFGLFAQRDMPEALRLRIAEDVRAATGDADMVRRVSALGLIPRAGTPAEFEALLLRERARWTEVARRYGVRPAQ